MSMHPVGYKLVKIQDGTVVNKWGGVWGQCPGVPNPLILPNKNTVCAPNLNEEYQGYMLVVWEMEEPPPIVPESVPLWAFRVVLAKNNLLELVNTTIKVSDDETLKTIWEYGNFAKRTSTLINSITTALGFTNDQMDKTFIDANELSIRE